MGLKLYQYNYEAYLKAKAMLDEAGKVCIIHPTGTGKSYIAFAFIEQNPDKHFLWISPNDYIYETQTGYLKSEQGIEFTNIEFHTYAWLLFHEDELKDLRADFIILDEFHRAGAKEWGRSIELLLHFHPDAKLLGLTATNIRYLDNQRDMADEIFEGCIASQMDITEAMQRGILPIPKYVVSVYSYQEKLKYYEDRIRNMKNPTKREENYQLLERLRRSLQQALGVPDIFKKYITDKTGKYLIFCSNTDHLMEMVSQASEWFKGVDLYPHIYAVYSDNPEAENEFKKFQEDRSGHLKLLFCIDMLNEGIHVDDVDGVILLRPTTSPIVYKQQIGRALAAGRKRTPLIFDLVNNFDSLYNIDTLKEEFDSFREMYLREDKEQEVPKEFQIFDELKDSRALFERLQNNLNFTWEEYFEVLRRYKKDTGDVLVPRRYISPEGLYLGRWLERQKKSYTEGRLSDYHAKKLEGLGVEWEATLDKSFETWLEALKIYKEEHGDVNVPLRYETADGKKLGNWCSNIRGRYKKGKLSDDRVARLNALGFEWSQFKGQWEEGFAHAEQYYQKYHNLNVPKRYVDEDGFRLGLWLHTQRQVKRGKVNGNLDDNKIKRLEDIGMQWEADRNHDLETYLKAYAEYVKTHNDPAISSNYVTEDGLGLGMWVYRMKRAGREGKLPKDTIKKLDAVGFSWNIYDTHWMKRYREAKAYYAKYGYLSIPQKYIKEHGDSLATWLRNQKKEYDKENHGKLSDDQVELLEEIHIELRTRSDAVWSKGYAAMKRYIEENGHSAVPKEYVDANGFKLGDWVSRVKSKYKHDQLSETQTKLLQELHMDMRSNYVIKRKFLSEPG